MQPFKSIELLEILSVATENSQVEVLLTFRFRFTMVKPPWVMLQLSWHGVRRSVVSRLTLRSLLNICTSRSREHRVHRNKMETLLVYKEQFDGSLEIKGPFTASQEKRNT